MGYQRKAEDKKRLKRLYQETKHKYKAGARFDEKKHRLIRYRISEPEKNKYWKRCANRKNRKHAVLLNHNQYKRLLDYKWDEMW